MTQQEKSEYNKVISKSYTVYFNNDDFFIDVRLEKESFIYSFTTYSYTDKRKVSYCNLRVNINSNPFGNCQNFSISGFCSVVDALPEDSIKDIFSIIIYRLEKSICILDLNSWVYEKIIKNKLFKGIGKIYKKTKYESTNGSIMYMVILYLDVLKMESNYKKITSNVKKTRTKHRSTGI
jgi:hypothetical protein